MLRKRSENGYFPSVTEPYIDRPRLEAALAWAEAAYRACDVCPWACKVDRLAGELGFCGLGEAGRVYKEYLHLGEERCLVPSHTVYLTGCNFRCPFCSDDRFVRAPGLHGVPMTPAELAGRIAERRREGARNLNFVGGLPDVNVLFILRTLAHVPADTHVVWNTNLWTTPQAIRMLEGVVGTWLVDFKFGNPRCARKLGAPAGYLATLRDRLERVSRTGGRILIRHLVMPGHLDCCTEPVLTWLARHHPGWPVNLMTGYLPFQLASASGPLSRRLGDAERSRAVSLLASFPFQAPMLDGEEYLRA
jgi:putative pyruvate formate lyase activating enzyme